MGTDIHGTFRRRGYENVWEYIPVPDVFLERDYDFFAILADVRNGFGFAGSTRYVDGPIISITSNRGLPEDFDYSEEVTPLGGWLGEHSFGYVSLKELKNSESLIKQKIQRVGYFSLKDYRNIDGDHSWCGDVSGGKVIKIEQVEADLFSDEELEEEYPEMSIYVRRTWVETPFENKINKLIEFMDLYKDSYSDDAESEIQFIFGFDS